MDKKGIQYLKANKFVPDLYPPDTHNIKDLNQGSFSGRLLKQFFPERERYDADTVTEFLVA